MWSECGMERNPNSEVLYFGLNSKKSAKLRIKLNNKERIYSVLSFSQEERGTEFT